MRQREPEFQMQQQAYEVPIKQPQPQFIPLQPQLIPVQPQPEQSTMSATQPQQSKQLTAEEHQATLLSMQQRSLSSQSSESDFSESEQPSDNKFQLKALSQMKGLSITQLVMGIICVIFGIVLVIAERVQPYYGSQRVAYVSYGIWVGAYLILLGGINLGAVKSNTSCWIILSMILNIISSSVTWILLMIFVSIGIGIPEDSRCTTLFLFQFCNSNSISRIFVALDSLILIMAIAELVISIWTAVLCCGAVCRCCKRSQGQVSSYDNMLVHQKQLATGPSGSCLQSSEEASSDGSSIQNSASPPPPITKEKHETQSF